MTDLRVYTNQQSVARARDDSWVALRATRDGAPVMQPWLTALSVEGKVFQVKAGTITAPLTGDIALTDANAEMCADVLVDRTIIPIHMDVTFENLNGGTLPEVAAKSVGEVSSAGTAFVPLNLRIGGPASSATARVQAAGSVTVKAELATDTRRHFAASVAAVADFHIAENVKFKTPPIVVGPGCFYVQVAGVTAGPFYFADFDFVDLATSDVV